MLKIAFIIIFFMNFNLISESPYRWPLDIKNGFSSTFGEFRYTHLHGGLDLRTFQKNGFPVFAITDGEIYRIRSVFRGSGNGIYMKHKDGRVSIYYHLENFGKNLKGALKKARLKSHYFGNYNLKTPLKVKKGEIIGYTGETGAGFPHLHLELQDGKGRKLNPLNYLQSPMKDIHKPVIRDIRLKSRGATLINGKLGEVRSIFLRKVRESEASPFFITGAVDLSSALYDVTDTKRKATPYKINGTYDGEPFYSIVFTDFVWKDHNQLGLIYDLLHSTPGYGIYNMSPAKGLTMADLKDSELFFRADGKRHDIKIEVADRGGNVKKGVVPVYHMETPVVKLGEFRNRMIFFDEIEAPGCDTVQLKDLAGKKKRSIVVTWENLKKWQSLKIPEGFKNFEILFRKEGSPYYRFPIISGSQRKSLAEVKLKSFINRGTLSLIFLSRNVGIGGYHLEFLKGDRSVIVEPVSTIDGPAFVLEPENLNGDFQFSIVHEDNPELNSTHTVKLINLAPNKGVNFKEGEFEVVFGKTSVRENLLLEYREEKFDTKFPLLSKQHFIGPQSVPFLDRVMVKITKKIERPKEAGIFQYNFRYRKWFYTGSAYNSKRGEFRVKRLNGGLFALLRDTFPPEVGVYVETRRLSKLKTLYIKATDKGKGISYRTLKVRVNGTPIACEYDPDRKYGKIQKTSLLKKGRNRFTIEVKDRAGNKTHRSIVLKFR